MFQSAQIAHLCERGEAGERSSSGRSRSRLSPVRGRGGHGRGRSQYVRGRPPSLPPSSPLSLHYRTSENSLLDDGEREKGRRTWTDTDGQQDGRRDATPASGVADPPSSSRQGRRASELAGSGERRIHSRSRGEIRNGIASAAAARLNCVYLIIGHGHGGAVGGC